MYCRNISYKLDELRRCGCRHCEEKYYHMRDGYERTYRSRDYYLPPTAMMQPALLTTITPKEPKMEEPKNIAIKILVDKLKTEQSSLASTETQLKLYETYVKTHRDHKNKNLRAIKELAAALKKLGHKDA